MAITNDKTPTTCPECGGKLLERTSRKDGKKFLGCENFTTTGCNYTFWGLQQKKKETETLGSTTALEPEIIINPEIEVLDTLKSILSGLREIYSLLKEIKDKKG